MQQNVETVDAVIISGPRRGEIVRLPKGILSEFPQAANLKEKLPVVADNGSKDMSSEEEVSEEDLQLLNSALDDVIAAIDRVSKEVRTTIEAFRGHSEAA